MTLGRDRRTRRGPQLRHRRRAPQRGIASRLVAGVGRPLVQVALAVIGLFWLVPTLGLFVASLRPESENASTGWWKVFTAPGQLTLDNYRTLVQDEAITRSFLNTVLITVPATLLVIIIGSMAAYALAWIDFPGRDWIFVATIGMLVVPIQIALIPIASLGILQFLWVWNDLLVALIFANSGSRPLTVYLASQTRQFGSSIDLLASGSFLSLVVPLVVFFSFQRFFVQGVMAGSVK